MEVHKSTLLRTVQSEGEESDETENEETDSELDTKFLPLINTLSLPVPISVNISQLIEQFVHTASKFLFEFNGEAKSLQST